MELRRQSLQEILSRLQPVETGWMDDTARSILDLIERMPPRELGSPELFARLLEENFKTARIVARLVLGMSKDELELALRDALGPGGIGVQRFARDRAAYLAALDDLGLFAAAEALVARPVTWRDLLAERLKAGRGSAIKGQRRGKALEDFVERFVEEVFGSRYDVRCRFTGAGGVSTEKADFAVPSRNEPRILIEVKAYGATGSKQSDILGDMKRIVAEKRHDTTLLFVTDGLSWRHRQGDLERLVTMQNLGQIARIYTASMADDLRRDLEQLRQEHGLVPPGVG